MQTVWLCLPQLGWFEKTYSKGWWELRHLAKVKVRTENAFSWRKDDEQCSMCLSIALRISRITKSKVADLAQFWLKFENFSSLRSKSVIWKIRIPWLGFLNPSLTVEKPVQCSSVQCTVHCTFKTTSLLQKTTRRWEICFSHFRFFSVSRIQGNSIPPLNPIHFPQPPLWQSDTHRLLSAVAV